MSTMSLRVSDSLRAFVESQAARKGYGSPNDYLEALILEDRRKSEDDEVERKLLEALLGAPATPVTAETWEAIKEGGLGRVHEALASTAPGIPIAEAREALAPTVPGVPMAVWRADIVGEWREELTGSDLLDLKPVGDDYRRTLVLRADGTADYDVAAPDSPPRPPEPTPPFPTRLALSDDRVLSIWLPIAPMPEYDMPDWSREEVCFDVLSVMDWSLALSNRRFDYEDVMVLRRVDCEEFNLRKYGGRMP
jgi:antitoxin ParD1/3/4